MPTLVPAPISYATSAPRRVVIERTVAATPDAIWDVLIDNEGWVRWYPTMKACTSTSNPEHGVGSTRSVHVGGLKADEEFIAWEPNKLWAFTLTKTNIPMASQMLEQVELEHAGAGTLVRYTGAFAPTIFTRPFAKLVEKQVRTAWSDGLDGLAGLVER